MFGLFKNFDAYAFSLKVEEALSKRPGYVFAERMQSEDIDVLNSLLPDVYFLTLEVGGGRGYLIACGHNGVAAFNAIRAFLGWLKGAHAEGWAEDKDKLLAWANEMREAIIKRDNVVIEPLEL
jgi:hypothetical protein